MIHLGRAVMMVALAALLTIHAAGAQDQPAPATPVPDLDARLAALNPGDPQGYFLLGEEVAAEWTDPAGVELARRLYVLAFDLDRRRGFASHLGASVCLALRGIERLDGNRRWLTALGRMLDLRYAQRDWSRPDTSTHVSEAEYEAAAAAGYARSGQGRSARLLLEKPEVLAVIRQYERLLGTTGQRGGLWRIEHYAEAWPCPQCHNERVTSRRIEPNIVLCPTCGGNPGPVITPGEMAAQLRFEEALLRGAERSWGAQYIADDGEPLRDPEPEELAALYRIDTARTVWRDGAWVSPDPEP